VRVLPASHPVPGEHCAFANMSLSHQNTRHGKRHAVAEPMCLARDDVISESVRAKGRWHDCHNHVLLWRAVAGWDGGEADVSRVQVEVYSVRVQAALRLLAAAPLARTSIFVWVGWSTFGAARFALESCVIYNL